MLGCVNCSGLIRSPSHYIQRLRAMVNGGSWLRGHPEELNGWEVFMKTEVVQTEDEKATLIIAIKPFDWLYVKASCFPSYLRTERGWNEIRLQTVGLWVDSRKDCQVRKGTCPGKKKDSGLVQSSPSCGCVGETGSPLGFLPEVEGILSGRPGDGWNDRMSSQCHSCDFSDVLDPVLVITSLFHTPLDSRGRLSGPLALSQGPQGHRKGRGRYPAWGPSSFLPGKAVAGGGRGTSFLSVRPDLPLRPGMSLFKNARNQTPGFSVQFKPPVPPYSG